MYVYNFILRDLLCFCIFFFMFNNIYIYLLCFILCKQNCNQSLNDNKTLKTGMISSHFFFQQNCNPGTKKKPKKIHDEQLFCSTKK